MTALAVIVGIAGARTTWGIGDPPDVLWNRSYPNPLTGDIGAVVDHPHDFTRTNDGGYVIAGSRLTQEAGMDSDLDAFLIRADSNGNLLWGRSYGTPRFEDGALNSRDDIAYSVVETPDGGFLFAGSSDSYGTGQTSYLLKTNSQGEMIWNRSLGGIMARDIVEIRPDEYLVCIYSKYYSYSQGSYVHQIILVNIGGDGSQNWNRTLDYHERVFLSSMERTDDGGYVLGMYTDLRTMVLKLNRFCEVEWSREIDPDDAFALWDRSYTVKQAVDGGYLVLGAIFSPSSGVEDDSYVVKLDGSGEEVWNRTYNYAFLDLAPTPDGGCVIVGRRRTSLGFQGHDYDLYLVKTDASGEIIWYLWLEEEPFDEIAYLVEGTEDYGYVVSGVRGPAGIAHVFLMELGGGGSPGILMNQGGTSCLENVGHFSIPVHLTEVTGQTVTVNYRILDSTAKSGLDYQGVQGTLIFDPGQGWKEVTVPIMLDDVDEETETATLYLEDATNAEILEAYRGFQIVDIYPPNHPPALYQGCVEPVFGTDSEQYRYYVNYDDIEDEPPEMVEVYVDGIGNQMQLLNGTASCGTYRSGPVELTPGEHDFYFTATDASGYASRLPAEGRYPGPGVEVYVRSPIVMSCDVEGVNRTGFWPTQEVYIAGWNFVPNREYQVYILDDGTWGEGDQVSSDGAMVVSSVRANGEGVMPLTLAWEPPLSLGFYDLLVDDGDGTYEPKTDGLLGPEGCGFRVMDRPVVNPFEPQILEPVDLRVSVRDGVTGESIDGAVVKLISDSGEVWEYQQGQQAPIPPGNYTMKTQIKLLGLPVTIQSESMEVNESTRLDISVSFSVIPIRYLQPVAYLGVAGIALVAIVTIARRIR